MGINSYKEGGLKGGRMFAIIFSGVIYSLVALVMIIIGISDLKTNKVVAFYTGEKPYRYDELSDVKAWNTKHGIMWIIYGVLILISWIPGLFFPELVISFVIPLVVILVPVFIMIWYHNYLIKKYVIKKDETK